MKQNIITLALALGIVIFPNYIAFAQKDNKTKCPPTKAFFKNKEQKKFAIKLPELPKIKAPKFPKIKLPDITAIKLPKLRKPQMPSFDFIKPDDKKVASTKCPK